ncbi:MAG: AbrB/MazE/SpoVT family DNA-binding domain-containing protein [Methanothrix sp.]
MDDLITNIDDNGRIRLPLAIRYGLHLLPGDKIAVDQLGDGTIILKKIEEHKQEASKVGDLPDISLAKQQIKGSMPERLIASAGSSVETRSVLLKI